MSYQDDDIATPSESDEQDTNNREDTPTEDTPIENTPIENAPIENTPIENTPIENDSAEDNTAKNSTTPLHAFLPIVCAFLALLGGLFSVIAVLNCQIDSKYLSGEGQSILPAVSLISTFFPIVCLPFFKGAGSIAIPPASRFFSIPTAAAFIYLIYFVTVFGVEGNNTSASSLGKWDTAILLLSITAALFFTLKLLNKAELLRAICAICIFALCTAIIAFLYLDFDIELNSAFKLAVQFGAVALIFGTIADARALLSRIGYGWFILLKSIAASLSLICSCLVITAFARSFTVLPESYLALSIVYFCYALSVVAELIFISIDRFKAQK